jgi:integrase
MRTAYASVRRPLCRPTFIKLVRTQLVAVIRGDRLEALWLCALTLGLRKGELLGLRCR